MARGVNTVILIGNLGADPDIRFTSTQKQVANLSIATSEQWTDKNTGQKQERTEWHRVVMFDGLAGIAANYLKKGSKVYIQGKLQTRKWQNQQGVDQYTTEVVANEMQMLDGASGNSNQAPAPQQPVHQQAPQPQQPVQQHYQQQPQQAPQPQQQPMQQQPVQQHYQQAPVQQSQPQAAPQQQQQLPQPPVSAGGSPGGYEGFDDQIPFFRAEFAW